MPTLTIKKKIQMMPMFFIGGWAEKDYLTPLTFTIDGSKANLYLEKGYELEGKGFARANGRMEIVFANPSLALLDIYRKYQNLPIEEANGIYSIYLQTYKAFEVLLQYAAGVEHIVRMSAESINSFFERESFLSNAAEWSVDGDAYRHIPVRFSKRREMNPLCKSRQLVTMKRWGMMQEAINSGDIPTDELRELYKIHSKTVWNEIRVPAIEASIISESLLRRYGLEMLRQNGFSSNKLKKLQNELSFNNLLNIILPLSLNKTERKKVLKVIGLVDNLRSIRNDLIHGNKTEKEIDPTDVKTSVAAAIKLVGFIKGKLPNKGSDVQM